VDWRDFAKRLLLADGRMTDAKTRLLRAAILEDGKIDRAEVEFLVDLRRSAVAVSPLFDRFLLGILKRLVLVDGVVSDAETAWLERVLFSKQLLVTDMTLRFLKELQRDAVSTGPRFRRLLTKWVPAAVAARAVPILGPRRPRARVAAVAGRR
jgi:hypothetical protein